MTPTNEEWRPVVGYEGYYEVSDQGRIRSLDHTITAIDGRRISYKGLIRKLQVNGGRVVVKLSLPNRHERLRQVSVMVLEAFAGPRPDGFQGCHNDGDPLNNRLSNLRWDSPTSNAQDTIRHGRNPMLNRTHCPRGHLLVAPNLQRSQAARGYRTCLACQRAMCSSRQRHPDVWTLADEKYRQIMQEVSFDQS